LGTSRATIKRSSDILVSFDFSRHEGKLRGCQGHRGKLSVGGAGFSRRVLSLPES
jgi:hypothetical protein